MAAAVSELILMFSACDHFAGTDWRDQLASHGTAVDAIAGGKIGQLIATLPKLTKIHLEGINGSILKRQLSLQKLRATMIAAGKGPFVLKLRQVLLTSDEIRALIRAFDYSVGELCFSQVASNDGDWHSIFQTIRSVKKLRSLIRDKPGGAELQGPLCFGGAGEPFATLEEGKRLNKGIRGEDGKIESYWIEEKSACMAGGKAVDAGLEVVLAYLAAHERPSARRSGRHRRGVRRG
ncbi:hypothetical protein LTR36_008140 [Oleoguttula mirabilis]|uniref:Uncharacterized protein n=1 Tax=Oleoguttula mirabilis TaxID=1507867 RepID=A0AAV9J825_9PEZI|nr:hypothetical protein LTR36_008140 [Oleoguttula mirabilis]